MAVLRPRRRHPRMESAHRRLTENGRHPLGNAHRRMGNGPRHRLVNARPMGSGRHLPIDGRLMENDLRRTANGRRPMANAGGKWQAENGPRFLRA